MRLNFLKWCTKFVWLITAHVLDFFFKEAYNDSDLARTPWVSISSKSEEWDWAIWINTWADKLITSLFNNKSSQIKQIIDCPEERLQCSCLLAHRHNIWLRMRHYSNGFAICLLLQGVNIWHRGALLHMLGSWEFEVLNMFCVNTVIFWWQHRELAQIGT